MKQNGWLSACALLATGLMTVLLPSAATSSEPLSSETPTPANPAPAAASPVPAAPAPSTAAPAPTATPAEAPKPPAQFTTTEHFVGGKATDTVTLSGVRFGVIDGGKRMVLDFGDAKLHPSYDVAIKEFPYRLVAHFKNLKLSDSPAMQSKGALPFSLVTTPDGMVKELQVFLSGPGEYKVIEVDDPAKLAIDVRPVKAEVPTIYAVQLTAPQNAAEAFALAESGQFPEGFRPEVLVIGQLVVVEQAFSEASHAAEMDAALRKMGYACAINERGGSELPSR